MFPVTRISPRHTLLLLAVIVGFAVSLIIAAPTVAEEIRPQKLICTPAEPTGLCCCGSTRCTDHFERVCCDTETGKCTIRDECKFFSTC